MKKAMLVSLMIIAVLGVTAGKAWSQDPYHNWYATVNIVNSAETPVMLSLENNSQAHAEFPTGDTCILQPGQSTYVYATCIVPDARTVEWNIIYDFYDGTDNINQRVSTDGSGANCAAACRSGIFSVSEGIYVDDTSHEIDIGDMMATWMGLSGVGEKVVGGFIDWGIDLMGYDPTHSTADNYCFSITIGQSDYNLDQLTGVDWDSFTGSALPSVTFVQGQQINRYMSDAWSGSEYLSNSAMIADIDEAGNAAIGTQGGQIVDYGADQQMSYTTFLNTNAVVQLSRDPFGSGRYLAAFGDSSVEYFDGTTATVLMSNGWDSAILQMCVNWEERSLPLQPQMVVGLADGAVIYYNGSVWNNIQPLGWGTSVMQLSASWDPDSGNLQVVAGLGDGAVVWWNGTTWTTLHDISWNNPVYQLNVYHSSPPVVVAALFNGAIYYCTSPTSGWTNVKQADNNYCLIDTDWALYNPDNPVPVILAGCSDGSVSLYQDGAWSPFQPATGNRVQYISVNWGAGLTPLNYVCCRNYQFTYAQSDSCQNYPAIPSTASTCGDIDGDGKDDLISVAGSNWYAWFSTSKYQVRGGPYDAGVYGTPAMGDIDGDRKDDLIRVVGTNWYVWTASSGYARRIGPFDLGIHGTPLTGDVDGDGKDDLIMVVGSLWYILPSSLDYAQRIGPFNTGHRGLPAAGDVNGDGLADLAIVKGSDWYVCYSIAPGQYGPWCGPYDVGISGAPVMGDIDGDGLADLIVVVGSDWYVWFSTSQYQVRCGPYTMSVL